MTGAVNAPATRVGLTAALANAPSHLRPVILAIRDHRVGLLFVAQGSQSFSIPSKPKRAAALVIVGDDFSQSRGPEAFHRPSLRRTIRACRAFAVVSSAGTTEVYAAMSAAAVGGRHAMIVETRLEHEFQWAGLIQKLAPGRPLLISTVKGGSA